MSDISLQSLQADQDLLEQLVADGDSDAAAACLLSHDTRLRHYLSSGKADINATALQSLTVRHADLIGRMKQSRDEAGAHLRAMRNSRQAVAAYQTARS